MKSRPLRKAAPSPGWRYDGNTLTTIVTVAPHAVTEAVKVRVERSAKLVAREIELDGFAGEMSRWADAGDTANHAGLNTYAPDSLLLLLQTGDRIGYRPELVGDEIARLRERYAVALKDTEALVEISKVSAVRKLPGDISVSLEDPREMRTAAL